MVKTQEKPFSSPEPRSFWPAAGIESSGLTQISEHVQSVRFIFSANQICQIWREVHESQTSGVGQSQSSRSLPQVRMIVALGTRMRKSWFREKHLTYCPLNEYVDTCSTIVILAWWPSCKWTQLWKLARVFQNQGVCRQTFPSFPSPTPFLPSFCSRPIFHVAWMQKTSHLRVTRILFRLVWEHLLRRPCNG